MLPTSDYYLFVVDFSYSIRRYSEKVQFRASCSLHRAQRTMLRALHLYATQLINKMCERFKYHVRFNENVMKFKNVDGADPV